MNITDVRRGNMRCRLGGHSIPDKAGGYLFDRLMGRRKIRVRKGLSLN